MFYQEKAGGGSSINGMPTRVVQKVLSIINQKLEKIHSETSSKISWAEQHLVEEFREEVWHLAEEAHHETNYKYMSN